MRNRNSARASSRCAAVYTIAVRPTSKQAIIAPSRASSRGTETTAR
ncbi:hypothetical protein AB0C27_49705 [Nonomuraea sp. NPDC048882]